MEDYIPIAYCLEILEQEILMLSNSFKFAASFFLSFFDPSLFKLQNLLQMMMSMKVLYLIAWWMVIFMKWWFYGEWCKVYYSSCSSMDDEIHIGMMNDDQNYDEHFKL